MPHTDIDGSRLREKILGLSERLGGKLLEVDRAVSPLLDLIHPPLRDLRADAVSGVSLLTAA